MQAQSSCTHRVIPILCVGSLFLLVAKGIERDKATESPRLTTLKNLLEIIMKRLQTLYTLLIASALIFMVACDSSDEVVTEAGETTAGETPAGATPAGETPAGETPAGETPAGETPAGETPAGETPAGETPAGETPAGETPAGETPAGETPAGEMMDERVGLGDTEPLSVEGEYAPAARLSALTLPMSPEDAYAGGCRLASDKNGTALGGLLGLAGDVDTNEFVQPDEAGEIQLVLLNHLAGWSAGATGNEAGTVKSNFYTGLQEGEDFLIDPVSLDADGLPIIAFNETNIVDGLYITEPSDFIVDIPLVEGLPLQLRLSQTEVSGNVTVDGTGFNMTEGVLGGYLTRDAIIELLEGISAVCGGADAPSLCDTVGAVLTGNVDTDLGLLLSILGGFDSAVDANGGVSACASDSPDCNAVSVCILLEMSSANVLGVSEQ